MRAWEFIIPRSVSVGADAGMIDARQGEATVPRKLPQPMGRAIERQSGSVNAAQDGRRNSHAGKR
jgi:hypothetical protein